MEIKNVATIERGDECSYLKLNVNTYEFKIILTEDNPKNVKGVFNSLLKELKKGVFQFELQDDKQDLFYHICREYLDQLNVELIAVHKELSDLKLVE